jgi:hypothetical protein
MSPEQGEARVGQARVEDASSSWQGCHAVLRVASYACYTSTETESSKQVRNRTRKKIYALCKPDDGNIWREVRFKAIVLGLWIRLIFLPFHIF